MLCAMTKPYLAAAIVFAACFAMPLLVSAQESTVKELRQLETKDAPPFVISEKSSAITQEDIKKTHAAAAIVEKITIKAFNIKGATLIDAAVINQILSQYQDKEFARAEVKLVADAITAAYKERGYVAVSAFIDEDIKDGIVEIQIIEPTVGEISITGNKNYSTGFIKGHLDAIRHDPSLKEETLLKAVQLLNEYPSLFVAASYKGSSSPDRTDVKVTVVDSNPITLRLGYDNYGTRLVSKSRANIYIDKGTTVVDGDSIRLSAVTGLDRIDLSKFFYGRIDYILPLGYNGTKSGIYYANSLFEVGGDLTSYKINGKANVVGVFIANPLIKKAASAVIVKFAFDYKDAYNYMLDAPRSQDKVRIISLGVNYNSTDKLSGRNGAGFLYNRGIQNTEIEYNADAATASRLYADPEFNKYNFNINRTQKITAYDNLTIRAYGQYSQELLLVGEQFFVGGATNVRGFTSSIRGESGYYANLELLTSPIYPDTIIKVFNNKKIGNMIKLALFVDNGGVYRNDRALGDAKNDYLTSIGAGIRIFYGSSFSAKADYAVPEIDGKYKAGNSEIYVQMTAGF